MKLPQKSKKSDGEVNDSFALPRSIAKVLRECAEKHGRNESYPSQPAIKHLWINMSGPPTGSSAHDRPARPRLAYEDWLNVVDEAASLGVQCMVICVGVSPGTQPDLWRICRWAQRVHGIDVGIHTRSARLTASEISELKRLDKNHTWLFVSKKEPDAFKSLKKDGIRVVDASVDGEEHSPPCDMSQQMLFVGPQGILYTCGLVVNDDGYRMGHVSEKPLEQFVKDPNLPHTILKTAPHRKNGCDACPPIMAKRMAGNAEKRA